MKITSILYILDILNGEIITNKACYEHACQKADEADMEKYKNQLTEAASAYDDLKKAIANISVTLEA